MESRISVIIPVYKVEAYIAECLDSVLSQSYRNIEVICVDDCGGDSSVAIAERYAEQDSRVKIIRHEHNRGVGPARNTGMDAASGDYIFFIDPDDIMVEGCLANLLAEAEKRGADVTVGTFEAFPNDPTSATDRKRADTCNRNRVLHKDIWFEVSEKNFFVATNGQAFVVWGKLYKTDFLRKNTIRFADANVYVEDMGFCFKVTSCNPSCWLTDIPCVRYRLRRSSITGIKLEEQKNRLKVDGWNVIQDVISFIRDRYDAYLADRYIEQLFAKSSLNSYFEKNCCGGLLKVVWIPHSKKISLFGLHLYREKVKKNGTKVYKVLGIPVWKNRHPFD